MESLYRKYRPLTFDSVVGQQHIVSTLEHAVTEGRLSHAYLFCGPRGTGKTTMARILAKALLCEHADAARAEGASGCMPDGDCPECQAIAEGTHPDVYELDAASRTGVDNVREEIVNSVSFAPVRGAYKVYIIDEVHMLTTAAFNALLKTLEEPPAHVVFVLCTTDPQKILETILSRCQRFDFHRISDADLVARMRYVCEQEGFSFDDEALEIVAKHARGGMRDALSTLEQLSVFGDGAVRVADARALLGEVASTVLSEFACKIAVRDTVGLFGLVRSQVDEGNDLLELTRDLVGHMRDVYTAAIAGPKASLFDGTPEEVAALVEEAKLFEGADRLARALTTLDDAALEMRNASDPRLVLEIALTRLARPESDLTLEALAERIARLETQLAAGVPSGPMGAAGVAAATSAGVSAAAKSVPPSVKPVAPVAPAAPAAPERMAAAQPAAPSRAAVPWEKPARPAAKVPPVSAPAAAASVSASTSQPVPASAPAPVPVAPQARQQRTTSSANLSFADAKRPETMQERTPMAGLRDACDTVAPDVPASSVAVAPTPAGDAAGTPATSDPGELQRKWAEVVQKVIAAQPSRGALLQNARAQSDDGSTLTIGFPKGSTFALKMVTRSDSQSVVLPIACEVFGDRSVEYVMDGAGLPASKPASAQEVAPAPKPAPAASVSPAQLAVPAPTQQAAPASRPESAIPASAPQPCAPAPASQPATTPESAFASKPASADSDPVSQPAPASVLEPATPVPRPESAPVPQPASAPQPTSAPQPAPAPAPIASAPAPHPPVDQASGPTIVPEPDVDAQRKAWEDEQVPYDDATIAAYEDDAEIPPFVDPELPAPQVSRASAQAPVSTQAVSASQPKQAVQPASASVPTTSHPFAHPGAPIEETPQNEEEAKALIGNIFGAGVIFKDVE